MTHRNTKPLAQLPHHELVAFRVAVELLQIIRAANIKDKKLRDEATRAAKSTCLNCAEGAGRVTRPDKARAFAIARGEAVEAIAALEIAAIWGDAKPEDAARAALVGNRLVALLTGLVRWVGGTGRDQGRGRDRLDRS